MPRFHFSKSSLSRGSDCLPRAVILEKPRGRSRPSDRPAAGAPRCTTVFENPRRTQVSRSFENFVFKLLGY
jgi:hypothetical protein